MIISGEHSCIYKQPVLATSIPLYLELTFEYHKRTENENFEIYNKLLSVFKFNIHSYKEKDDNKKLLIVVIKDILEFLELNEK